MSKDNFISAVFGVLLGFIAGYLMHEVMAARQPPRRSPDASAAMAGAEQGQPPEGAEQQAPEAAQQAPFAGAGGGGGGVGAPGGAAGGGAPMMAQVQSLKEILAKDPKNADALRQLGDLYFDISEWEQARDLYTRYLEVRPNDPDVMTDLGVTYRGLKQFDRALEVFEQVGRSAPDHWQSRYNQVVVLAFDLNRLDAAKSVLDELKRMQPNNEKVSQLAAAVEKRRAA